MTHITGGAASARQYVPATRSKEHQLSESAIGMGSTRKIEAVIFDCDGVLVDSEPMHDAATREELRSRGIALPDTFFEEHVGMRVADQMTVLAHQFALDPEELYRARERRFWALATERFTEVPGSVDAIRRLHSAKLKIAVATSGNRRWIDYVVDRLGVADQISATVSGDDVSEPKPHPEPYLAAAAALGVSARRCGVVEDSERGYLSAVAADCVVVVLDRTCSEPHRFADATAVTTSMSQARDFLLTAASEGVDRWRQHRFPHQSYLRSPRRIH